MYTIFIDMDDVLADLTLGLKNHSGFENIQENRSMLFKRHLPAYAQDNQFAEQPVHPHARVLVENLLKLDSKHFNLAILTSCGDFYDQVEMVKQKKFWLINNLPELKKIPFLTTSSGADKAVMAHKNSLLIDDHHKNIEKFSIAGGKGIWYNPSRTDHISRYIIPSIFLRFDITYFDFDEKNSGE